MIQIHGRPGLIGHLGHNARKLVTKVPELAIENVLKIMPAQEQTTKQTNAVFSDVVS